MSTTWFVTHADVVIDAEVPITEWGLNPRGVTRHRAFADLWVGRPRPAIFCSAERKARDGADILAEAVGGTPIIVDALHENDRSATGFIPEPEFSAVASEFFAHPDRSIRGWETARDAQARIVAAVDACRAQTPAGCDAVIIAHGGVGALWVAAIIGQPIDEALGPGIAGGGGVYGLLAGGQTRPWRAIEAPDTLGTDV